jgi:hypothetical protein
MFFRIKTNSHKKLILPPTRRTMMAGIARHEIYHFLYSLFMHCLQGQP